jgi:hypothetical protein
MSELTKLKEEVNIEIRSLLCSSKDGLSENELRREYMNLYGKEIPFFMLGFRSIHQLMQNLSNVEIRPHKTLNLMIYHAKFDEATIALGKLIKGQVDKNKQKRESSRKNEANRQRNIPFNRYEQPLNQRERSHSSNGYRNYNDTNANYNLRITSSSGNFKRTVVQSQNGFIPFQNKPQIPTNQIKQTNQIPTNQIPTNQIKQTNQIPTNQIPTNQIPTNQTAKTSIKTNEFFTKSVSTGLKKQIKDILNTAPDYQLTRAQFEEKFIAKYCHLFSPTGFGFNSQRALLESLDDILHVELLSNNNDDYRIRLLKCPENKDSNEISNLCRNIATRFNLGNSEDDDEDGHDIGQQLIKTSKENKNEGTKVAEEFKIKVRQLSVKEKLMGGNKSIEHKLNLLSVDQNRILVHWSQVADLFNINPLIFKSIFQLADDKLNNNELFISYKFNQDNSLLFDVVQNEFKIDLQKFDEQKEVHFLDFERLNEYCNIVFTNNAAHRVKFLIENMS